MPAGLIRSFGAASTGAAVKFVLMVVSEVVLELEKRTEKR